MNKKEKGSKQSYKYCATERFVFLADASDTAINGFSWAGISHKQSKVFHLETPWFDQVIWKISLETIGVGKLQQNN